MVTFILFLIMVKSKYWIHLIFFQVTMTCINPVTLCSSVVTLWLVYSTPVYLGFAWKNTLQPGGALLNLSLISLLYFHTFMSLLMLRYSFWLFWLPLICTHWTPSLQCISPQWQISRKLFLQRWVVFSAEFSNCDRNSKQMELCPIYHTLKVRSELKGSV